MKKVILGLGLIISTVFGGNQFEINLNSDTMELGASFDLKNNFNLPSDSNYSLDFRFLRTEEVELGEDSHHILNMGFKVIDSVSDVNGAAFGLGMDVLFTDTDTDSFFAIPFAVFGSYTINSKFFVDASVKYSPSILSFSSAESYKELKATANYSITSNASAYVGTRWIKAKYDNYELNFDKSVFAGFKFQF
jgi:hypothetical protein